LREIELGEIASYQNGYAFKPDDWSNKGLPIIRIQNLNDPGKDYNYYDGDDVDERYFVQDGDVLIAWSASLGVYVWNRGDAWLNQHTFKVNFENDEVDKSYFVYAIQEVLKKIENKLHGSTMKHITKKKFLKLKIPLPSLSEQKAIVAKLDRAQRLIDIDKEMLAKYDALIQSVFLEMFGDPVTNPKGWEVGSITDYGSFKNGLNYSSNESGTKIRSLGVGDFGVLSKIDDIRAISRIELDEAPPENYLLKDNDLVFVRSNGNKELVGRCLVIYPSNEDVTFSGFCIRYRPKSSSINSTYLSHLFRVKSFRNYMLKDGRGANIQNINQKLLSQLDIPLPDISKQNQFAKNVEKLEGQILKTQTSRKKSKELFSSLVQGAFG
jgi:type I restriction enzyme S subunit